MPEIEDSNKLDLHDCPIGKIIFDTESTELIIEVLFHVKNTGEYERHHLKFNQIKNLKIGVLGEYDGIEIYDWNMHQKDGLKYFDFIFDTGFSKPSWEISFEALNCFFE